MADDRVVRSKVIRCLICQSIDAVNRKEEEYVIWRCSSIPSEERCIRSYGVKMTIGNSTDRVDKEACVDHVNFAPTVSE